MGKGISLGDVGWRTSPKSKDSRVLEENKKQGRTKKGKAEEQEKKRRKMRRAEGDPSQTNISMPTHNAQL